MIFGVGRVIASAINRRGIFFGAGRECLGQKLLEIFCIIFFMIGRDCLGQKLAEMIYVIIFRIGRECLGHKSVK